MPIDIGPRGLPVQQEAAEAVKGGEIRRGRGPLLPEEWAEQVEGSRTDEPYTLGHVKTYVGHVQLRYSFWRHPILWWKTRHLLPDMERVEREGREAVGEERYRFMQELEEVAFLCGTDSDEFKRLKERGPDRGASQRQS